MARCATSTEPGTVHQQLLVVTRGLEEGEKVVVVGVQKVRDGVEVKASSADAGKAGSVAKTSGS